MWEEFIVHLLAAMFQGLELLDLWLSKELKTVYETPAKEMTMCICPEQLILKCH